MTQRKPSTWLVGISRYSEANQDKHKGSSCRCSGDPTTFARMTRAEKNPQVHAIAEPDFCFDTLVSKMLKPDELDPEPDPSYFSRFLLKCLRINSTRCRFDSVP